MKYLAGLFLVSSLMFLGGCASKESGATSEASHYGRSRGGAAAAPMGAAQAPTTRYSDVDIAPERPGLGTSWGEYRNSQVGSTTFARNSSSTPNAVGKLFYNDRAGVHAMTASFGGGSKVSPPMKIPGGLVSIWLKEGSGRWFPGVRAGGNGFVIGDEGDRYEIYLKNECRARVEVVTSVDGLDVMDGKSASYRKRGYVLAPGESVTIDGFRTSFASVAAFRFGSVASSYAAQKHNNTRNVGVIGAAVFVEKGANPWTSEPWVRQQADPFPTRKWATEP